MSLNSYVLHKHCWSCGAQQLPDECPHCRADISANWTYCTDCGGPLRKEFAESGEKSHRPKLKRWQPRLHSQHFAWVTQLTREDQYAFDNWLTSRLQQSLPPIPERVGIKGLGAGFSTQSVFLSDDARAEQMKHGGVLLLRELIDEELSKR